MSKVARRFSREMKLAAVLRMLAGENVSALARELKLRRKLLYEWRDNFRLGGPEALRSRGRPRKSPWIASSGAAPSPTAPVDTLAQARRRVAELERKIGQQQVELDFFRQALGQVREKRQPSDGPGTKEATPPSRR